MDRQDREYIRMAQSEKMILPGELQDRIEATLAGLPERRSRHFRIRTALPLAAALALVFSVTAVASARWLDARMAAMNQEMMEEYFTQIYASKMTSDNYNRPMTEEERGRLEALRGAYEEGRFPERDLTMLKEADDYKGRGVAFLSETSTFFLPEELDEEQLLEILDFWYKRDYSLARINGMIETGEMEFPKIEKEEPEFTDAGVPAGDSVGDPAKELVIAYEGELGVTAIGEGRDGLFLGGHNEVQRMESGSGTAELFYDGFEQETAVTAICQAADGRVYIVGRKYETAESFTSGLWIVEQSGELIKEVELGTLADSSIIQKIAVDKEGYIYLKGMLAPEESLNGRMGIAVLSQDGQLVSCVTSTQYRSEFWSALGMGRDGRVYTCVEDENDGIGIARVNPVEGCLDEVMPDIIPDGSFQIDLLAPGSDSDFVFFSYDGLFTYNVQDDKAKLVQGAVELPFGPEGGMCTVLPDGRVVFATASERTEITTKFGYEWNVRKPESLTFYYLSTMK